MRRSIKGGLMVAALVGAGLGSVAVPSASQAGGPECDAGNRGNGGWAMCLHARSRVWFKCRRAPNGTLYEVHGPVAAPSRYSVASCISGDLRVTNAQFDRNPPE